MRPSETMESSGDALSQSPLFILTFSPIRFYAANALEGSPTRRCIDKSYCSQVRSVSTTDTIERIEIRDLFDKMVITIQVIYNTVLGGV